MQYQRNVVNDFYKNGYGTRYVRKIIQRAARKMDHNDKTRDIRAKYRCFLRLVYLWKDT